MPFHSFSRDAALVLVDALLTLDVLMDLMVFMIEEPDFINILDTEGTPGRILVLGILIVLGPAHVTPTVLFGRSYKS